MIISNSDRLLTVLLSTFINRIHSAPSLDCKNIHGNDISKHVPTDYEFIYGNHTFLLNLCNSSELLRSAPLKTSGWNSEIKKNGYF